MKHSSLLTVSAVLLTPAFVFVGGCSPIDYYPANEPAVSPTDNEQTGSSGVYGGFDSTSPIFHPKGMEGKPAVGPSTAPASTAPASTSGKAASAFPVLKLGLSDGAANPDTGTYGGSNVGGGTSAYAPNDPADISKYSPADPGR